jgi:hypothetical protein
VPATPSTFADSGMDMEEELEMEELGKRDNTAWKDSEERGSESFEGDEEEGLRYEEQEFRIYTQEEEKKVLKKLDRRVVLFVAGLYLLSFLDRSSKCISPHWE